MVKKWFLPHKLIVPLYDIENILCDATEYKCEFVMSFFSIKYSNLTGIFDILDSAISVPFHNGEFSQFYLQILSQSFFKEQVSEKMDWLTLTLCEILSLI